MSTTAAVGQDGHPRWFKSSYSAGVGTDCIEISASGGPVRVRDSKDPDGHVLDFSGGEWIAFVREVRRPGGMFERG